MRFFKPQDDTELERLATHIRDAYADAPDDGTKARHVSAMAAAAREADHSSDETSTSEASRFGAINRWRNPMRRNRRVVLAGKLVASALGAVALMTGLAFAGVTLPEPAQQAFERVGVASEKSEAVHDVIEQRDSFSSGCEFGQAVAEAASGGKQASEDACKDEQGAESERNGEGGAETQQNGESQDDFGRTTSEDAQGQKDRTVEERREFGQRTKQRALDHAQQKSGGRAGGGQTNGQTQSQQGRSIGESKTQDAPTTQQAPQDGRSFGDSVAGENRP